MLFSSSLVLLGVLSTVRGHPNHHHHKAIARQFNAPAPPPAAAGASSHSGQPGAPAATQLPPGGSLVGQSAPPATTPSATGPSTTLPDATLTATDPAIPPLSELTSGISSSTPAFTFVPTLGAPGPYPGAPPIPSSECSPALNFFILSIIQQPWIVPGILHLPSSRRPMVR